MVRKIIKGVIIIMVIFSVFILFKQSKNEKALELKRDQTEINDSNIFSGLDFSGFDTITIEGEEINSEDCFKENEVTMVNIWITGCGPCVGEIPEIAELYNDRPEGTNIITICLDATKDSEYAEFAIEIMKDANAEFKTLIPDYKIIDQLKDRITLFPTTVFVDSTGKILGEAYFGANTKEAYNEILVEKLNEVESNNE